MMYSITNTFHNGKDKTGYTTEEMSGKDLKTTIAGMIEFGVFTKDEAKIMLKTGKVDVIRPRHEMAPWCSDGAYQEYTLNKHY